MKRILAVLTLGLCATAALAQAPAAPQSEDDAILIAQAGPGPAGQPPQDQGPRGMGPRGGEMGHHGPMKFWNDSELATKINLTDQQKQQLETTFTNYRLKLIDQRAAVQREEVKLEPLIQADKLDEGAITRQIDALIAARGQMEKTTAMMGLDIRKVLSTEQWKQLKQLRGPFMMGMGGPGMGGERHERQDFRQRRDRRSAGGDNQAPPQTPPGDQGPK